MATVELRLSPTQADELRERLRESVVTFIYKKKSTGEPRLAHGTTKKELFSYEFKGKPCHDPRRINYFDLDRGEWRSLLVKNLVSIELEEEKNGGDEKTGGENSDENDGEKIDEKKGDEKSAELFPEFSRAHAYIDNNKNISYNKKYNNKKKKEIHEKKEKVETRGRKKAAAVDCDKLVEHFNEAVEKAKAMIAKVTKATPWHRYSETQQKERQEQEKQQQEKQEQETQQQEKQEQEKRMAKEAPLQPAGQVKRGFMWVEPGGLIYVYVLLTSLVFKAPSSVKTLFSVVGLLVGVVTLLPAFVVAIAAWAAVAVSLCVVAFAARTVVALTARTALALYIALGLLREHTVGELIFARLRVYFQELHLDVVALVNAGVLNGLKALPRYLRDVEQAFLARQNLYEAAVRHDAFYHAVVDLANLRQRHDSLDLGNGGIDALLVGSRHLHVAHAVGFVDGDGRAGILLHLLDDFSTGADDSTDKLLRNGECLDARHLRLELLARLGDGLHHLAHDVLAASLSLHESLLDDVERQAVALYVHLCGCQSVLGARSLKVHVAEVVFVAEDVGEDCILTGCVVCDKTHCDTADGAFEFYTCIEECQCAGANSCHR